MVMGNSTNEKSFLLESISKDSNNFFSEPICNKNESFVSKQLTEDDMATNI